MSAWVIVSMPSMCDLIEAHPRAERQARQQRELVRGVEAADVESRIGLGVALGLRLLQHIGERAAFRLHLREDVVAGAVEDAVDAAHLVGGQRLAQRLDDGDAARHRRLEVEGDALLLGQRASSVPCLASSALLAVTTCLPAASAASTACLATPSSPPISSTNTSMPGSAASSTGSSNHWSLPRSTPRFLRRSRADTPTTSIGRPTPLSSRWPCVCQQAEQTGADGAEAGDAQGEWLVHASTGLPAGLLRNRDHVMHGFRRPGRGTS